MIKIVTSSEITLTTVEKTAFNEVIETVLPEGTEVTLWLKAPKETGEGVNMYWEIPLVMWIGDHTQKDTVPKATFKEVSSKYKFRLFNDNGTYKYPFTNSTKDYIFAMIDDQNRMLEAFFYANDIFPQDSLEIVGI